MTTQATSQSNNGRFFLLLLIAVAACAAALYSLGVTDLELTTHASQGRVGTSLDASAISSMISAGTCTPVEVYDCPAVNQRKIICSLKKSGLWAGLIIGTAVDPPVIVTGYPAPYKYWMGTVARDGCYLTNGIPIG